MQGNNSSRRRFIRTATATAVAITGGAAISGSAAADSGPSGTVTVRSENDTWNYTVGIATRNPNLSIEKGSKADPGDTVEEDAGNQAWGTVNESYEDTYSFPNPIATVVASPQGSDAKFRADTGVVTSTSGTASAQAFTAVFAIDGEFDYYFSYDGELADVSKVNGDGGDNDGVAWVNGHVSNHDNYRVAGYLSYMHIDHPEGGSGLVIDFDP